MSFVAKVLVVFNLIISAFFLYFALHSWAAATKWEKMYQVEKTRNVKDVADVQKTERDLAVNVAKHDVREDAIRKERDEEKRAKESFREKVTEVEARLATKENENALTNAERQEEARENKRLVSDLDKAHKVVMKLEQAVAVERNNAQAMKNQLADNESELAQAKTLIGQLNRDLKTSQQDAQTNANTIAELIRRGYDVYQILQLNPDQPLIEAKVLAVKPDVNLVMLSAGSNQGVKPGYHFMVSNGPTYKGTVQVDKVWPDMSSARIILTPKDMNVVVDKNDDARTR
ncbi:MAG TPA: hypothetical protein VKX17_14935 [Planctomycetota bacterium]|nr:hypothetical protein [Planctomycetota bacterium]